MSRLLVTASLSTLYLASSLAVQQLNDAEITAQIEKAKRLVAVDARDCVKYPISDEIVVYGAQEENKP